MYEIKNKVILVTGGAGAIGAGIVTAFLKEGAKHVAIIDINTADGERIERELASEHGTGKVKFYKCDITTDELSAAFENVVNQNGYIDVVVNCAGILNDNYKVYVKCIEVNVTALITSSFKAYELMRKDRGGKGGTIINISSHGAFVEAPMVPVYCATKSAVLVFSRNLGSETTFSRTGVRVLSLCLGLTDTSMVAFNGSETFDPEMKILMQKVVESSKQTVSTAVSVVMAAYKDGRSGSTWSADASQTPIDITNDVDEGMKISSRRLNLANLKHLEKH